ncbi:MAG: hypothetical protein ACFCVE_11640 [Phycisphaerae bacterium]
MSRISLAAAAVLVLAPAALAAIEAPAPNHARVVLFGEPDAAYDAAPARHRFVPPITAPYFAEDPFITSDIRPWVIYHKFTDEPFPSGLGGGDVLVGAVQLRLALTDRLQFVAYKDGYADFDGPLVDETGYFDVGAGIKWNFLRNVEEQLHVSAGVGIELAVGDDEVLQDDEAYRFFLAGAKGFDNLHLGATLNYIYAPDKNEFPFGNSDKLTWHLHADYYVNRFFSPVVEVNGYHKINAGDGVADINGLDVVNLGGDGKDFEASMGVGFSLSPAENISIRAAYEFPLTGSDEGLFDYRVSASAVFAF